ncbi:DUF5696 domain-containing protein [Paenibacillus spongiae]|uniref:DUF5696 domain-containing protein n=1 Tax=Paenibacillus spongiae TaxID=2909671 RepID=A0ABY5S8B0_9BACL|nr:DUF5696 domain-containing protein [Paenibacillus spongiae]UVI30156.1 DUF5696 domain-containing protein [Paenibacillus spongiae]
MRRRAARWMLAGIVGICLVSYPSMLMLTTMKGDNKKAEYAGTVSAESAADKPVETAVVTGKLDTSVSGLSLVQESESLQLYIDPSTTEIAIKDKRSGRMWYSNPMDREADEKAEAINRDNLSAQLSIVYNNDKGQTFYSNNFAEAIKNKQFEIQTTDKGIKVVYQLGNFSKGMEAIPQFISKQRMDEKILSKLQDEDMKFEIEKRFFLDEETQIYRRKEMPDYVVKDVVAILDLAGYTEEDAKLDNEQNKGGEQQSAASAKFTIPIEYALDGTDFLVRVAASEIKDSPEFPINSVQVLEMFGAAGTDREGYMLVPDGSGALIHLNNGKTAALPYEMPLYGKDQTLRDKPNEPKQFTQKSRLPVFGMKQGDQAFFCIIEEGDAVASILADVSGRVNSYNRVSASFLLKPMELFTYRAGQVKKDSPMFPDMYQGNIKLRYTFLSGESADYAGMAKYYQGLLVKNGQLTKLDEAADTPFILDMIGSIPLRETFLGIPYQSVKALTTFEQAESLLAMLKKRDMNNIQLRYSGWFNKGMNHDYPDDVDIDGVLGGEDGFRQLVQYAKEQQIELYPDVSFLRVYRSGHGFKPSRDGTQFLFRKGIGQYKTDLVTTNRDTLAYYLLSPKRLPELTAEFMETYGKWEVGGISLRDLGDDMNSDVKQSATLDRQGSAAIIAESVEQLSEQAGKTMVSGGNAGVLPYASTIVNAPLGSSQLNIADEEVPFYQMVLHGFVDYAGMPINMNRDQSYKASLLKTLETGSNVYYQWFYEKPSAVRNTEFDDLYSAHYANWFNEAVRYYREANEVLKGVRNQAIINHEKLVDNVYRTTYEGGRTITVNYNKTAVTVEGMRMEEESYAVGGEER